MNTATETAEEEGYGHVTIAELNGFNEANPAFVGVHQNINVTFIINNNIYRTLLLYFYLPVSGTFSRFEGKCSSEEIYFCVFS